MLKTELLADIEAKVLKIVSTVEEPDAQKNAVGIKSYMTNVMEQTGKTARGRNIGWYTVDEGLPTEQAFYRDELGRKNDFQTRADNYLSGLVPATFLKATSFEVDEDSKTATAIKVALPGSFIRDDTWAWTVGGAIYLSETTGALTQTAPTTTDAVVRVLGYALSADVMYFMPETGVVHA